VNWLEYDYLIASTPTQCAEDALCSAIQMRTATTAQRFFIDLSDADALLLILDAVKNVTATDLSGRFEFDGSRLDFEVLMANDHPNIVYRWVDQYVVAFADRAAQLSFDDDLGGRVLRCVHLPRAV
jgi:hypothetical protein